MNWTLVIFSLVAATIPMVSYLAVIWRLDRYDREPIWLVSLNFIWGAFGATILGFVVGNLFERNFIDVIFNTQNKSTLSSLLTAPFIEELAKGVFLNTKEQVTFDNEEAIKDAEKNFNSEPDDEELQDNLSKYQNKHYKGSAYWLTDRNDKIIGCIHNSNELDAFIAKKKLL